MNPRTSRGRLSVHSSASRATPLPTPTAIRRPGRDTSGWALARAWPPETGGYYAPVITRVGVVAAATVLAVAAVAAVRLYHDSGGRTWLWAAALLGLPAGWLGPFGAPVPDGETFTYFGRLAQVVLASCAAMATMRRLARPVTGARAPRTLARAGALAVGCGAGLSLGVPVVVGRAPWQVTATAVVLIVAGLAARAAAGRTGGWRLALVSAAARPPVTWLISVYANEWTTRAVTDPAHTATLAATVGFIPLTFTATAAAAVIGDRRRASRRPRRAAWAAVAVSLGWLGWWTLPYLPSWGPALLVFAACAAAPALARRA